MFGARFVLQGRGVYGGFRTRKGKTYRWADYVPSAAGMLRSADALHEYPGLVYGGIT